MKAVFFDRDGVINYLVRRDDDTLTSPFTFSEFVSNLTMPQLWWFETTALLASKGYATFVVTNQPHWAKELPKEEHNRIIDFCLKYLNFDTYRFAIHRTSGFYKPSSGMIEKLMADYMIDPTKSFLIGDRSVDTMAGNRVNLNTIQLPLNQQEPQVPTLNYPQATYYRSTVEEAINLILECT